MPEVDYPTIFTLGYNFRNWATNYIHYVCIVKMKLWFFVVYVLQLRKTKEVA